MISVYIYTQCGNSIYYYTLIHVPPSRSRPMSLAGDQKPGCCEVESLPNHGMSKAELVKTLMTHAACCDKAKCLRAL